MWSITPKQFQCKLSIDQGCVPFMNFGLMHTTICFLSVIKITVTSLRRNFCRTTFYHLVCAIMFSPFTPTNSQTLWGPIWWLFKDGCFSVFSALNGHKRTKVIKDKVSERSSPVNWYIFHSIFVIEPQKKKNNVTTIMNAHHSYPYLLTSFSVLSLPVSLTPHFLTCHSVPYATICDCNSYNFIISEIIL